MEETPNDRGIGMPSVTPGARKAAEWALVALIVGAFIAVVIWLLDWLSFVTVPLAIAVLLAALLNPVYVFLVRRGLNRSVAAFIAVSVLLLVIGLVIASLVNIAVGAVPSISEALSQAATKISDWVETTGAAGGLIGTALEKFSAALASVGKLVASSVGSAVASGVGTAAQALVGGVLAITLMFFFLRDSEALRDGLISLFPADAHPTLHRISRASATSIFGYVRGATMIAVIDAALVTIGLLILQVPGAVGLGGLVLIGAYIPYVGAFLSGSAAVLVAFADGGVSKAVWAIGIVVAVQFIEGNFLQPIVQSRTTPMHPVVILVALAVGGGMAGLVGILLAVPVAAVIASTMDILRHPEVVGGIPEAGVAETD